MTVGHRQRGTWGVLAGCRSTVHGCETAWDGFRPNNSVGPCKAILKQISCGAPAHRMRTSYSSLRFSGGRLGFSVISTVWDEEALGAACGYKSWLMYLDPLSSFSPAFVIETIIDNRLRSHLWGLWQYSCLWFFQPMIFVRSPPGPLLISINRAHLNPWFLALVWLFYITKARLSPYYPRHDTKLSVFNYH